MTTLDASAPIDPTIQDSVVPMAVPLAEPPGPAVIACPGYRAAKYLAASHRRSQLNRGAYAMYDQALASWCVK